MIQTAVEYIIDKVKSTEWQDMFIWHKEEVFEQAKKLEKEQIMNAYNDGRICIKPLDVMVEEEYYNQTYNQNK